MLKKLFSILFVIYFISLVVVPCGDKENCNEYKQEQTSQTDHKQGHSDEACTPFCFCSCCAAPFLIKDFHPLVSQTVEVNTIYTELKEFTPSAAIIPIWQPPKLA